MRKLMVLVGGIALAAAVFIGTDWLMQRNATAERSASDRSAAIEAVATAEPSLQRSTLSAPFWNPDGDSSVVQVQRSGDRSLGWNVTLQWDASTRESTLVTITVVTPK